MMWMFFHTQISDTVLFKWWKVETVGSLLITCLVMYFGAVCFEALKWLRLVLEQRSRQPITANTGSNLAAVDKTLPVVNRRRYSESLLSRVHLLQTFLFTVQLLLSYLLMLAFMTFSVWIGIAICAGAATGFWLFGKREPILAVTSGGGAGTGQSYASTGRTELH
uniref:Copper transport protein n=1 Tax=Globodera rostochiensis TaxID=31243 RepID=A0A914GU23_GLORO